MKKIVIFVVLLLLVISLAGCKAKDDTHSTQGGTSQYNNQTSSNVDNRKDPLEEVPLPTEKDINNSPVPHN